MSTFLSGHRRPGLKPALPSAVRDERGYLLPIVLMVLVLGTFLILPLLSFVSTSILTWEKSAQQELAYYAADAGIEAVLSDLRQGRDALAPSYSTPLVALNRYTATITIAAPSRVEPLPSGPVFADPGASTSHNPLASQTAFLYQLDEVRAGSPLQLNWLYTPTESDWTINIYEGSGTGGTQVVGTAGAGSPARVIVSGASIRGGTYTIRFFNSSNVPIYSAQFSHTGETVKTWLRAMAFKEYVITSTVGLFTIAVYARQAPGPNPAASSVGIISWHGPH